MTNEEIMQTTISVPLNAFELTLLTETLLTEITTYDNIVGLPPAGSISGKQAGERLEQAHFLRALFQDALDKLTIGETEL